ncbi:LysR family transcriptional regulator ArgP [Pseudaestuariivita rosea]|uniref:LysR family transcriptional regulator ArgP n=1 Tax=Pseudaestuariivita rosea TaxID=2763263 RepID=UPI00301412BE
MLDYSQLEALAAVAKTGSFDQAAAELSVTPSAISQRIKALEERAGAVLIVRGQPCQPTQIGARLIRHFDDVMVLEHTLAGDIGPISDKSFTTLKIAVNADSLATWFLPPLSRMTGFLFDLVIDDQDHSADLLRCGQVIAAITSRAEPVQGCNSHPLGALRYSATATPDFMLKWLPHGATPDALKHAPTITFSPKDRLQVDWIRKTANTQITPPTHMMAGSNAFVEAACLGLGWCMNPDVLIQDHLKRGTLRRLNDTPLDTPLYWQVSRHVLQALAPLTKEILKEARDKLVQSAG